MLKVTHIITGLNDGGAEGVLYRLCTYPTPNVEYSVISLLGEGKYGPLLRKAGVSVTCLNMLQGRLTFSGVLELWRALRIDCPDVVQTWMYHADLIGGIFARLAGVRLVFWGIRNSTLDPVLTTRSTITTVRLCSWLSAFIPTRIICCAQEALVVHRGRGYSARNLMVIPNGYDLDRFAPNETKRLHFRRELGADNRWLLGMVGRFDPVKDHKNLLDALAILKKRGLDFYAVLIGSGLDKSNVCLMSWLESLGLTENVYLLGQRSDVPTVMNGLDVHVLSSAGEAFPNVVAEAMACGVPAVVTDVGDAATIVGKTGWVVPSRNPDALANALLQAHVAMQDKIAWQSRRGAVRRRVEDNFSLQRMVQKYQETWMCER